MKFDMIVSQILDKLLETTEIDPAAVEPDDRLKEDLGLSPEQIGLFLSAIGKDLNVEMPSQPLMSSLSLRQLVDQVKTSIAENTVPQSEEVA